MEKQTRNVRVARVEKLSEVLVIIIIFFSTKIRRKKKRNETRKRAGMIKYCDITVLALYTIPRVLGRYYDNARA